MRVLRGASRSLSSVVAMLCACLVTLLVAGCGGPTPPGGPSNTATLTGTAWAPDFTSFPKPGLAKGVGVRRPFDGARAEAIGLRDGKVRPAGGAGVAVAPDGSFSIPDAPTGEPYVVRAWRGTRVVARLTETVPDDATTYDVGDLDPATTAVAYWAGRTAGAGVHLEVGDVGGMSRAALVAALAGADLDAWLDRIRALIAGIDSTGTLTPAVRDLLLPPGGTLDAEGVDLIDVYLMFLAVIIAGDETGVGDVIADWLDDGTIGAATPVVALVLRPDLTFAEDPEATPDDLEGIAGPDAPPETTLDAAPDNPAKDGAATFGFSASEAGSTFECNLDGAGFSACVSPATHAGLLDGAHTFAVRATDPEGNTDATPAAYAWTVDTVAPVVTADGCTVTGDAATCAWHSDDPGAADACRLDGAPFAPCTSPRLFPGLADGPHTFMARATDAAGNTGPAATTDFSVGVVDTTPPTVTITDAPADPSNVQSPTFQFTADEAATFACNVDGTGFVSCVNPAFLFFLADGTHTFQVRATDAAANTGAPATYTWTVDATAPGVSLTTTPPAMTSDTGATFAFTVDDPTAAVTCSTDGAAYAPCTSPVDLSGLAEGSHSFGVQATDAAGNQGTASFVWIVDTTPPTLFPGLVPDDPSNLAVPGFTFFADEFVSYTCDLDGAGFAACASPYNPGPLAEGSHTVQIRATDGAGNATTFSHTWTVDLTAPTVTLDGPPDPSNDFNPSLTFTADEPVAGFTCALDAGLFQACTSPHATGPIGDGAHTFEVRATDPAGNEGSASHAWTTDITPPGVTLTGPPPLTTDTGATFTFGADETVILFECQLDGGGFATCGSPETVGPLAGGAHTFDVRATDLAGNVGGASHAWTVDDTPPPDTVLDAAPPAGSERDSAAFTFHATKDDAHFECDLDGAGFLPCPDQPTVYGGLAPGSHTFQVRAVDTVGRTDASPASYSWTITTPVPDVVYAESFEGGMGDWTATAGIWEVGTATSGPGGCFAGSGCAATVLDGDAPLAASTLISPAIALPAIGVDEQLFLRFRHWFAFGNPSGSAQVRVRVETSPGVFGAFEDVDDASSSRESGVWVLAGYDLSEYAGQTVQIGFAYAGAFVVGPGWYLDNVSVVRRPVATFAPGETWAEAFEGGMADWSVWNGAWEAGLPTGGPGGCFGGSGGCAGTVLDGAPPFGNVNVLFTPPIRLPAIGADQEVLLRYQEWFDALANTTAVVLRETAPGHWQTASIPLFDTSASGTSGGWSRNGLDLSALAGQTVQVGFTYLDSFGVFDSPGWFLDDVAFLVRDVPPPSASGRVEGFEAGMGDWRAWGAGWRVGSPTAGPGACYGGSAGCAATSLDGTEPNSGTLHTPSIRLPAVGADEQLLLRFRTWFENESGVVTVQVRTSPGIWATAPIGVQIQNTSGGWTSSALDVTGLGGETIQVSFLHLAGATSGGWFLDDMVLETHASPVLGAGDTWEEDFNSGLGPWWASNGVWQVGQPTSGPGACDAGSTGCAATVLDGDAPKTTSILVGPVITLPAVAAGQEITLQFRQWYDFGGGAVGRVVFAEEVLPGIWNTFLSLGQFSGSSGGWVSSGPLSLTDQAGHRIQIGFQYLSGFDPTGPGWYVDGVSIVTP